LCSYNTIVRFNDEPIEMPNYIIPACSLILILTRALSALEFGLQPVIGSPETETCNDDTRAQGPGGTARSS